MRNLSSAAQLWIYLTLVAGGIALGVPLVGLDQAVVVAYLRQPSLWLLLGAATFAHAFPVVAPRHQAYHATPAFLIAAILLLDWPGVALVILAAHLAEWVRRRRPWYVQLYNVAAYLLSAAAAAKTLDLLGRFPSGLADPGGIVAALAAGLVFLFLNHGLTAIVLRLARGVSVAESGLFGRESLGLDGALLLVGIALAGAWLIQPLGATVAAAPLVLLYRALRLTNVEATSHRDAVTGLYNARHFREALQLELLRAEALGQPTAVLIVAVDNIPRLVQRFGRGTLDFLMLALAERLKPVVRAYDLVSRLGEGALGVLVPGADAEHATSLAHAITDAVATMPLSVPTTREPVAATASVTARSVVPGEASAQDILAAAARTTELVGVVGAPSTPAAARPPAVPAQPMPLPTRWQPAGLSLPILETVIIGLGLAITVVVGARMPLPEPLLAGGVVALVVVAELLAFELYDRSSFSISFVPILAAGLLGGPLATLLATWSVALVRGIQRASRWDKVLFNGSVLSLFGLLATTLASGSGHLSARVDELPMLAAATLLASAVYYLHTFVIAVAVALDLGGSPAAIWARNFRWLFPHYLVLGAMALGLAVATVELGLLGSALFLAPPLMMRFVLKQYTDRTAGSVQRLEVANAELRATSDLLRRRGDDLALLSDLGRLSASDPRAASLPSLVASRCVPALGDMCAVLWRTASTPQCAVEADAAGQPVAHALRAGSLDDVMAVAESVERGEPPDWAMALGGAWHGAALSGVDQRLGWMLTWSADRASNDDTGRIELIGEVARRLALVLERDALLEEAASVDALRAVDRARSDFIAIAAHDLRTPLTSLQGYAELLHGEVDPQLRKRWTDILHLEAAQLGQVLDQLLDVSRLDAGRFSATRRLLDLGEVTELVAQSFDQQARVSGHTLEVEVPHLPLVYADPNHVARVLSNLLSNAMKYSPAGGPVRVVATVEPGEVEVCVEDRGLGLPREWLDRLFERFQRVDLPERASIRGTGLGLYIARQLVEMNGGRIWATSVGTGCGASFHFTLPAPPPNHAQAVWLASST